MNTLARLSEGVPRFIVAFLLAGLAFAVSNEPSIARYVYMILLCAFLVMFSMNGSAISTSATSLEEKRVALLFQLLEAVTLFGFLITVLLTRLVFVMMAK